MRKFLPFMAACMIFGLMAFHWSTDRSKHQWDGEAFVQIVMHDLGSPIEKHFVQLDKTQIERGRQLVHLGKATAPDGTKGSLISKFYNCTSCHNIQREDPDLRVVDSDARLDYAIKKQIPYLQGSTFYGVVNRTTWYNGDYDKKYGEWVARARTDLRESIQLCAQECAQGRELETWEMDAILHYFQSLGLRMKDLRLTRKQIQSIQQHAPQGLGILKAAFLNHSPATFSQPPDKKTDGYPISGDADRGASLYQLSCQHCHRPYGESDVLLDNSQATFRWLQRNFNSNTDHSIYEVARKGTPPHMGHKPYMPLFTQEKMSDRQLEDLRAFIEREAQ